MGLRAYVAFGVLAVTALGWWQYRRAEALSGALTEAQGIIAGYEEAAAIKRRTDAQIASINADAAALDMKLEQGEGADAPLSDYLGNAAGRLWPD